MTLNKFSVYKQEISSHIYTKSKLYFINYALQKKNYITNENKETNIMNIFGVYRGLTLVTYTKEFLSLLLIILG